MSFISQYLREPASALTHALWFLAGLLLISKLLGQTREFAKRSSILVYGFTLLFCSGASTLFHAIQADHATIEWYNRLDHVGIGLLIAGTYTPIAAHLLERKPGTVILSVIWLAALASATLRLTMETIPKTLATSVYLLMGWGALPGYWMICRRISAAKTRMIAHGGLLYSIGALIHWLDTPELWTNYFDAHALFHVFVMLGSLKHFQFIRETVITESSPINPCSTTSWPVAISSADLATSPSPAIRKPFLWSLKPRNSAQPARNKEESQDSFST